MGKTTGFLEFDRNDRAYASVEERVSIGASSSCRCPRRRLRHRRRAAWIAASPIVTPDARSTTRSRTGTTSSIFGAWQEAARNLHSTNNFPDFTGRICPAPCEASCTLNIDDKPVTIKTIEHAIIERGFAEGWVEPEPPARRRPASRVAVVGSGPAGLACAQQLARAGHDVHVFEKSPTPGGLLRYGIPDFKMEKHHVDRRVAQMRAEGVRFHSGVHVGVDPAGGRARRAPRRRRAGGGAEKAARPAGARPRAQGHPLRDGIPAAAEPARRRRAAGRRRADPRHRQARGGDRRRRHRLRLHRHLDPPGRAVGHQYRDHAEPPEQRGQAADLAGLADEAAHLVQPRGRRRARLGGADQGIHRRERLR